MALLFVFGVLDLWTALYIWTLHFDMTAYTIAFIHSLYLFGKGTFFWGDLYSFLDILVSAYILFAAMGLHHWIITLLCFGYLLQKSALSLRSCFL